MRENSHFPKLLIAGLMGLACIALVPFISREHQPQISSYSAVNQLNPQQQSDSTSGQLSRQPSSSGDAASTDKQPPNNEQKDDLVQQAMNGDQVSNDQVLAREGFMHKDEGAGGKWTRRTMAKDGEAFTVSFFLSPAASFVSTANYQLTMTCPAESNGIAILLTTSDSNLNLATPDTRVDIGLIFTDLHGLTYTRRDTWLVLSDGRSLLELTNSTDLFDRIAHSKSFGFQAGEAAALFDVEGFHYPSIAEACASKSNSLPEEQVAATPATSVVAKNVAPDQAVPQIDPNGYTRTRYVRCPSRLNYVAAFSSTSNGSGVGAVTKLNCDQAIKTAQDQQGWTESLLPNGNVGYVPSLYLTDKQPR
jgi:hypothetical protein